MEFEVNEFKVNEYITLRLEGSRTNIYINNEFFNQCKKLIVEIPPHKDAKIHNIESIDDVEDVNPYYGHGYREPISPEVEFWGHCSNLQAWAEYDYDTRLLHRNLAFPLFRKLVKSGDIKARKVYKDEIVKRIASGNPNVIT